MLKKQGDKVNVNFNVSEETVRKTGIGAAILGGGILLADSFLLGLAGTVAYTAYQFKKPTDTKGKK